MEGIGMKIEDHKNLTKVLHLTPLFISGMILFTAISMMLNFMVLFNMIQMDDIANVAEKLQMGIGFVIMVMTIILVAIFIIIFLRISISMLRSRFEVKELERDGGIAGIMLLSVIPVAFIGMIPYFGDVISGFDPILYIGGFIVYYRKMLPAHGEIYKKIAIRLLFIAVISSVTANIFDLTITSNAIFIIRILAGIILITSLIQIYRMNKIVRIAFENKFKGGILKRDQRRSKYERG